MDNKNIEYICIDLKSVYYRVEQYFVEYKNCILNRLSIYQQLANNGLPAKSGTSRAFELVILN